LRALADDLAAQRVETLIIIGANPAYDGPGDLRLGDLIAAVPFSAHFGLYADETAMRCRWHLPMSHPLESWSDLRAFEGTASIVQPLIRPLYDTQPRTSSSQFCRERFRRLHATLSCRAGGPAPDRMISPPGGANVLHNGVVPDTAARPVAAPPSRLRRFAPAPEPNGFTLTIAPDPSVWDGSFANNAWLQECPQPLTKQVWGNALHVSPADGKRLGLVDGDVVRLEIGALALRRPFWCAPANPENVVAATLGYGRQSAGAIGNRVGLTSSGFERLRIVAADRRQALQNRQVAKSPAGAEAFSARGRSEGTPAARHTRRTGRGQTTR